MIDLVRRGRPLISAASVLALILAATPLKLDSGSKMPILANAFAKGGDDKGGGKGGGDRGGDDKGGGKGGGDRGGDDKGGGKGGGDRGGDDKGGRGGGDRGAERGDDRGGRGGGERGADRGNDRGGRGGADKAADRGDDKGTAKGGGEKAAGGADRAAERGANAGAGRSSASGGTSAGSGGRSTEVSSAPSGRSSSPAGSAAAASAEPAGSVEPGSRDGDSSDRHGVIAASLARLTEAVAAKPATSVRQRQRASPSARDVALYETAVQEALAITDPRHRAAAIAEARAELEIGFAKAETNRVVDRVGSLLGINGAARRAAALR